MRAAIAVLVLSFLSGLRALAAPGDLDPVSINVIGSFVATTAVQPDGKIIIGGRFDSILGTPRTDLARLNADGTLDTNFDPDPDGEVRCVVVLPDGKILIGGGFSSLVRLKADGTVDATLNSDIFGEVNCIAVQPDGKILIGGTFFRVGISGPARNCIARLNADGTLDQTFDPKPSDRVENIFVQPDGKIVFSGWFTTVQPNGAASPTTRGGIARVNSDGTLDTTFNPLANNDIDAMVVQPDGKMVIAGAFTQLLPNGGTAVPRRRIARINTDGTVDQSFTPSLSPTGTVSTLALQTDGKVLLGGSFSSVISDNGQILLPRSGVARLGADGTFDEAFSPNADGNVQGISLLADGRILVAGSFTSLQPNGAANPVSRNRFAILQNDSATQTLSAGDSARVLWLRQGAGPAVDRVTFEVSTDNGVMWTSLGSGTRIGNTSHWEFGSLTLPTGDALLRARGRAFSGRFGSSLSIIEQVVPLAPTATLPPILLAPASGSSFVSSVNVDFILPQKAKAGSLKLSFGAVTLTLASTQEGAGRHTFSFDPANPVNSSGGAIVSIAGGTIVPDGPNTVTLSYQDVADHPAATASATQVSIDGTTLAPVLTLATPVIGQGRSMRVVFSLPEAVLAGSVKLNFDNGTSVQTFTLKPEFESVGDHFLRFNPDDPMASGAFDSASALADGTYAVTVSYQDTYAHAPASSAPISGVLISSIPGPGVPEGVDIPIAGELLVSAVQPDGKIILAGIFSSVAGVPRSSIARLNTDGTLDLTFDPNPNPGLDPLVSCVAVQPDGKIIFGGNFSFLFPNGSPNASIHGYIVRVNADGTVDESFNASLGNQVECIALQTDGKILIGGYFTAPASHVARLNADGTFDASFRPNPDDNVFTIAVQPDGGVLFGGFFHGLNPAGSPPLTRHWVARVDANGNVDESFNPNPDQPVRAIALQPDGKILLGGNFFKLQPNGAPSPTNVRGIARIHADGTLDPSFATAVVSTVNSIALQTDGKILLGGDLGFFKSSLPGFEVRRDYVVRLNSDGTADEDFDPNPNDTVNGVAMQGDGRILLTGEFQQLNSTGLGAPVLRDSYARIVNSPVSQVLTISGPDDVLWQRGGTAPEADWVKFEYSFDNGATWLPVEDGTRVDGGWRLVSGLAGFKGQLRASARIVGGWKNGSSGIASATQSFDFDTVGGSTVAPPAPIVSSVQLQGQGMTVKFRLPEPALSGSVKLSFVRDGEQDPTQVFTLVPAFEAAGSYSISFDPDVPMASGHFVSASALADGTYSVTLSYQDAAAHPLATSAAASGVTIDSTLAPGFIDPLNVILGSALSAAAVQPDGKIVIGGNFSSVYGEFRSRLARLNADGTLDFGFVGDVAGSVFCVAVQPDGKILVGGNFGFVRDFQVVNIARLAPDGTPDPSFGPGTMGTINCIAVQPDGKIVIGGAFSRVQNIPRNRIARLNADGTLDLTFDPNANGTVNTAAIQPDGKIVIGGAFVSLQPNGAPVSTTRNRVARLNPDGTLDESFDPNASSTVRCAVIQPDGKILLAGSFSGFTPPGATEAIIRPFLARLAADGTVDQSFNPRPNGSGTCLALQSDGKILFGGTFSSLQPNNGPLTFARTNLALINPDGSVDADFSPNPNGTVSCVALEANGMYFISGQFTALQPQGTITLVSRNRVARIVNRPAGQALSIPDETKVRWSRIGSAPRVSQVTFEISNDLGITWTPLGNGTRVGGGAGVDTDEWELTGLELTFGLIRARGVTISGDSGGSQGLVEQVQSFSFVTAPPTLSQVTSALFEGKRINVRFTLPQPALAGSVKLTFDNGTLAKTFTLVGPEFETLGEHSLQFNPDDPMASGHFASASPLPDGTYLVTLSYQNTNGDSIATSGSISGVIVSSAPPPPLVDSLDAAIVGGTVFAAAEYPDGRILIAGDFTSVLGVPRRNLARLNADGTLDTGFDPKPNDVVSCVAIQPDSKVLIGGSFTTLQPPGEQFVRPYRRLARLNPDGTIDQFFSPQPNGDVLCIALQQDGWIVVGGQFDQFDGTFQPIIRRSIARITPDGIVDFGFDPNVNGAVHSIAIADTSLILFGGSFSSVQPNGAASPTARLNVARVFPSGALDAGWNPGANDAVYSVVLQRDGQVLLGGAFTELRPNGATVPILRNRIARLLTNGTVDPAFDPNAGGEVRSIAVQVNGQVLIGGDFETLQPNGDAQPTARKFAARLFADGEVDSEFDPSASDPVFSVGLQGDGSVLLGGAFSSLKPNGAPTATARNAFARLGNDAAISTLFILNPTLARWQRGGSAPEVTSVIFDFSPDAGANWFQVGIGLRVPGTSDWQAPGIDLTGRRGLLRARGYATTGSNSGSASLVGESETFDFDTFTLTPILSDPANGFRSKSSLFVDFTLPEPAKPGSATLTFADGVHAPITLTFAAARETAQNHVFRVDLSAPVGEDFVSGAPVPDGTYTVTLTYRDTLDHEPASAVRTNVTIDNAGPVLDLSPVFVQLNDLGEATLPNLASIASDPAGVFNFVQDPPANTPVSAGVYLVSVSALDRVGNVSTGFVPVSVGYARPQDSNIVTIAATGDDVPTGATFGVAAPAGAKFVTLGSPAISDNRITVAKGTMPGSDRKKLAFIYAKNPTQGGLVAYQGSPAPGTTGAVFKSFLDPLISPNGRTVIFAGKATGGDASKTSDDGVWRATFDSPAATVELILREGSDVPGLPAGSKLKSVTGLSVQNDGILALVQLVRKPGVVTAANDSALIFISNSQPGALLARKGDSYPDDLDAETTIKSLSVLAPAQGSPGHGRWQSLGATVAKLNLADKRTALVQFVGGTVRIVLALSGDGTGLPDGTKWAGFNLPAQSGVTGDILAIGTLAPQPGVVKKTSDTALGVSDFATDSFTAVQREGGPSLIAGLSWAGFFDPVMNNNGFCAFLATLKGAGVTKANKTALWFGDAASPTMLARLGDPASPVPDAAGMPVSGRTWQAITSYALPNGFNAGPVFIAKVKGAGVKANTNLAIYGMDSQGALRELLRTGDMLDGKSVKSFTLLNAVPGAYGVARNYNATGSLALVVTFTDKTQSLLRLDLP